MDVLDVWNSQKMKKLGEVERSLLHAQAEISVWNVKLDVILKSMNDGLGFLMGLKYGDLMKSKTFDGLISKYEKGLYVNKP